MSRPLTEERAASRVTLISIAIMGSLLGLYTSMQSSLVLGVVSEVMRNAPASPAWELVSRSAVNLISVGSMVVLAAFLHPERRRGYVVAVHVIGIALASSVFRAGLQASLGIYDITVASSRQTLLLEIGTTTIVSAVVIVGSLVQQRLWRRVIEADNVRFASQERVNDLLRALQEEELRVRREISHTLHGSVQSAFIVLEARLGSVVPRLGEREADEVGAITQDLARLREGEIRTLSAALYPADLERGVRAALTTILERVPPSVAVRSRVEPSASVLDADDVDIFARILVIRVIEEALSNALKHGGASELAVRLSAEGREVTVTVDNNGDAPPAAFESSGLARLRQYLQLAEGRITLSPGGDLGGARLRATLTV